MNYRPPNKLGWKTLNYPRCKKALSRKHLGGLDPDNVVFREPGIGCEMCHGPSAAHVEMMTTGKGYTKSLSILRCFNKITNLCFWLSSPALRSLKMDG
jgi:hypothetical protein